MAGTATNQLTVTATVARDEDEPQYVGEVVFTFEAAGLKATAKFTSDSGMQSHQWRALLAEKPSECCFNAVNSYVGVVPKDSTLVFVTAATGASGDGRVEVTADREACRAAIEKVAREVDEILASAGTEAGAN
jgi:hypothetical protein